MKFINPVYLEKKTVERLKKEFRTNKPFPHLVLKDFFKREFLEKVKEELQKQPFERSGADLYQFKQSKDFSLLDNESLKGFYNCLNSKEFKDFLKEITGIEACGELDCSGFIYEDKDYLLPHDDHLESRKIAYIVNLTTLKKEDGGALEFFREDNVTKSIIPTFNSFIFFPVITNKTFHQVSEVITSVERLTISGWFNEK